MSYSEEFLAGWRLARERYQVTGGVQPYPPGFYEAQEVAEGPTEVEASEGVDPLPKGKPPARKK